MLSKRYPTMKHRIAVYFRKCNLKITLSLVVIFFLYKWMNKLPRMPDAPVVSEVDAMDFFENKLKGDGLNFTWAHATNSLEQLHNAQKAKVYGIEADVVFKNEGTSHQEQLPIMAHPPKLRSDLTLQMFLHETILGESLIKLDFKTLLSVGLSLQIINEVADNIKVPVWLNADILQGPGDAPPPSTPASSFINKLSSGFHFCTISLGWTTNTRHPVPYTWSNVYEMYTTIMSTGISKRKLTFPVAAAMLKNSIIQLKWLCEHFDSTLTVWQSSEDDHVDISELVYLRSKFPKDKIYYDLMPITMEKFRHVADNFDMLTQAHRTREEYSVDTTKWILKVSNLHSSDLKVGEDVVWLSGPEAQLKSFRRVTTSKHMLIRGAVSFIAKNFTEQSYKSSLQIFVFGEDHLDNHPSGIRCSIDNFGRMIIASDHVEGSSLYLDKDAGVSRNSCYHFELRISGYTVEFSASAPKFDCNVMQELHRPQSIKTELDSKGLLDPFYLIMRNGRSEGYAILEQLKIT